LAIRKFTSENSEQQELGRSNYKLVVKRAAGVFPKRVIKSIEECRFTNK